MAIVLSGGGALRAQTAHFSRAIASPAKGSTVPARVKVDGNPNPHVAKNESQLATQFEGTGGNFGQVNVGTASSSSISVEFTFDRSGLLLSSEVLTEGAGDLDFTDAGNDSCQANITYNAGNTCTVNVTFKPTAPGPRYGSVVLLTSGNAVLATGYVQGTGVAPMVTFASTSPGISLPGSQPTIGSGFFGPGGVAVDGSHNIYVADSENNAVKLIAAAGGWTQVSTIGSGFEFPSGVAVDGAGNVFVADTSNDAVEEIVAASGYNTVLPLGSGFSAPYGVAVDGNGNVFVADYNNGAVDEIVAAGGYTTVLTLASNLNGPDGVAVDSSGDVFVANYNDGTVDEIVAVDGSIPASPTINTLGSGFYGPDGLSVDGSGNVYVADSLNNAVKEILAAGGYTTVITLGTGFTSPEGVALDANGNVFVADDGNDTVDLLDYADAPPLSFATTAAGATSSDSPQTVTVTNSGNAALTFPVLMVGDNPGVPANFAWDRSSTCAQTTPGSSMAFSLAAGESCTMAFDFTPATGGNFAAGAVLTDNNLNVAGARQTISLSGSGLGPAATLSSTSLSFGSITVGASSGSQTVTMTNTGTAALTITSIAVTGANASSFAFANSCGTSLAAGANCTIHGHFGPAVAGALTAAITITDNAGNSPQTIALSGTGAGIAPPITLSATSLSFPSTAVGAASSSESVTVTNVSSAALSIASIAVTGTNATSFVFANSCGSSLAAGANCTIHGHFAPVASGALTAAITITYTGIGSPQNIALSGTGTGGGAKVTLSATSLAFGSVNVGSTSASQSITMTNSGTAALSIASIAVTGTNASSFGFANSCGTSLASGANCTIHGHFAPTSAGALTAAVTITDNAGTSPQTIALSGTGGEALVTLSATSLAFGSITVGSTSNSQTVTMTNTGTAALSITSIAVTGTNASSFAFANSCGTSLAAGANCTIHGHFAPTSAGALKAAVTITDSAPGSPQSIALSGTGAAPATTVTLSATSLSFGTVTVGQSSGSQTVTMTNTGTATLTITSIAVTGANASQFAFANSCGTSLAAGANCTIHGHFAPAAAGAMTAAVSITDSATGSPQSISLSGTGQ